MQFAKQMGKTWGQLERLAHDQDAKKKLIGGPDNTTGGNRDEDEHPNPSSFGISIRGLSTSVKHKNDDAYAGLTLIRCIK
ncbi:hypothetical protein DPMN_046485 [Dreissena polymorpha]|uniref:Uncharacterized protein n=1 Tax=Dreissena polymorpha TaxID=45954 RepID=A0A9D4HY78_DREPO|nr:hypothetical protein DPMN_046485 [Dreissena polymorpha]